MDAFEMLSDVQLLEQTNQIGVNAIATLQGSSLIVILKMFLCASIIQNNVKNDKSN